MCAELPSEGRSLTVGTGWPVRSGGRERQPGCTESLPPCPERQVSACRHHCFHHFSACPALHGFLLLSEPIQPPHNPQRLLNSLQPGRGVGLTAGGLPGRGPSSCRKAGRCNSLSSNGPPGPHRRRSLHLARESLEAAPLAPPPSSCTEHQSSQRGCQTGPVGTPKPTPISARASRD